MIALFGGTFNPVHNGHIALACEAADAFRLQRVEFLPSFLPVHRADPQTDPQLRRRMIELAIADYPQLTLNDSELSRQGLSYSVDTLEAIRRQAPGVGICWLMGADAFNGFASWKQPDRILQLANLIVCRRPDTSLDMGRFDDHRLASDERLSDHEAGKIALYPMRPNTCSSTQIRERLQRGQPVESCLAPPVLNFIRRHNLYEN